jgi:hypothetical protein
MPPQLSRNPSRRARQTQQEGGENPVRQGPFALMEQRMGEGVEGALAAVAPVASALSTSSLLDELPERRPMTVILVSGAWGQFCCATA